MDKEYVWEPIEIKPNDQSLVGEVVRSDRWSEYQAEEIIDIGLTYLVLKSCTAYQLKEIRAGFRTISWFIRRKKPKQEVWAFGMFKYSSKDPSLFKITNKWLPTTNLVTWQEMTDRYPATKGYEINWPAMQNPDGTFTEPNE